MKRIATIVINPQTVNFVVRDITGGILFFEFPTSRYDSVKEVVEDAGRVRGTVDHVYVGGAWTSNYLGQELAGMDWPTFRAEEVSASKCAIVELTKDTDATQAMLLRVQDEVSAFEQSALAS